MSTMSMTCECGLLKWVANYPHCGSYAQPDPAHYHRLYERDIKARETLERSISSAQLGVEAVLDQFEQTHTPLTPVQREWLQCAIRERDRIATIRSHLQERLLREALAWYANSDNLLNMVTRAPGVAATESDLDAGQRAQAALDAHPPDDSISPSDVLSALAYLTLGVCDYSAEPHERGSHSIAEEVGISGLREPCSEWRRLTHDQLNFRHQEELEQRTTDEVALFQALVVASKLCQTCRGTGSYESDCPYCSDSGYDHACITQIRECADPTCLATRAALRKYI